MPPIQYWFTGTALFLACSFVFTVFVGLVGIKEMIPQKLFWILMAIALVLSLLAWFTAAKQQEDAANQKQQSGNLGDKIDKLTEQVKSLATQSIKNSNSTVRIAHFQLSQRRVVSSSEENPFALQVIIQTDETINNTKLAITCNNPISHGDFFVTGQGVMMNVMTGLSGDKKSFEFGFSFPSFTPDSPIVVTLLSKTEINCTKLTDLRFSK